MLQACDVLDPRAEALARERPISGAVNIPLEALGGRVHELPPREREIRVVSEAGLAGRCTHWLRQRGRVACSVPRDAVDARGGRLRMWEPTAFLAESIETIDAGRALDVACGTGRDAVFLASAGCDVTAVDVLPDALDRGRELEQRYLDSPGTIDWRCIDVEREPPEFDASFDLITVFRFLHRPLFDAIRSWLAPGGTLLIETFTTEHRARRGRPSSDAHVLRPGELRQLVAGMTNRHYSEAWRGDAHTARCRAERPRGG